MPGLILPPIIEIQRELARRTLLGFTRLTFKKFIESWHHTILSYYLTKFALGEIPRLMLFMPPRHGKTEFSSRRMPAFILGKNPDARIIGTSYGADLAGSNSKDVQQIIASPEYQGVFPNTKVGGKKETEHLFTILNHDGYYRAAGIGGGIGGYGASFGLIDDPIKDAKEAESKVYRDGIWEWYLGTFYPRLEDPGHILLTTTRWNEDDLAGRLLREMKENAEADQWVVVNLPAIYEVAMNEAGKIVNHVLTEGNHVLQPGLFVDKHTGISFKANIELQDPREPGEALWPSRFPIERLQKIRGVLHSYWFSALFQGMPQPAGGVIFKREWFKFIAQQNLPTSNLTWCRYWDSAGTEGAGDYTVGALLAYHEPTKTVFIVNVVRGQWSTGTVDDMIKQTAKLDGYKVRIREEREGGSSGLAVINARRKELIGYDYNGKLKTGKKETEWKPLAGYIEGGNVFLVQAPWNADFIDELVHVPTGDHDDQADAASGGFNDLVVGPGPMQIVKLAGFG
jgi:predicted phage terminase large subunit-like protein